MQPAAAGTGGKYGKPDCKRREIPEDFEGHPNYLWTYRHCAGHKGDCPEKSLRKPFAPCHLAADSRTEPFPASVRLERRLAAGNLHLSFLLPGLVPGRRRRFLCAHSRL